MICIIDLDHTRAITLKEDDKLPKKQIRLEQATELIAQYYKTTYPSYKKKLTIDGVEYSDELIVLSFKREVTPNGR